MHFNKSAISVIIFFLVMAFIVPAANNAHWGMPGIFVAMVVAVTLSFVVPLLFGKLRERLSSGGLTHGELVGFLVGYAPESSVVEAEPYQNQDMGSSRSDSRRAITRSAAPTRRLEPVYVADEEMGDDIDDERDDLPTVIIEPNGLYLSDCYQPSIESLLGQTVLLCGIRRSGKSNGLAVLAEEQARYAVPFVIGDTEDEYAALADPRYLPQGVVVGSLAWMDEHQQRTRYIPIDLGGAYEFGKAVLEQSLQVVLNLKSFESDNEAAMIMCEIIEGMNDWESTRPNASRVPCMFLLDEANKWLPQQQSESYVDKEILAELHKAFFGTMVRRGGKRGLGLTLTTQRIVELDKRALQSTWKFLFRQSEQVDIERYKALGLDGDAVQALRPGACFVFSPGVLGFPMQMRERSSPHLSHTPGLAQLRAHLRQTRPFTPSDTFASPPPVHPGEPGVSAPPTMVLSSQAQEDVTSRRVRPTTKLERALEAWNAGHQSIRALAAALSGEGESVSTDEAYRLICQLDAKGLITRQKRSAV
jgi:hypothetical protein